MFSATIHSIELHPIALPVRRIWKWRGLAGDLGRSVIVRVRTSQGQEGFGEAVPLPDWGGDFNRYGGETIETVRHVVRDHLTPAIAGLTPFDIERVIARMDAAVRGHTYAKAAIEMALFDLQGKIVGQPVFNLLGGRVHDSVEVTHMVGIMDPDEAEDEVRNATAEGTRSFQIKGTGQLRRDVDVVRRLRSITDESVTLRFDANQGYRGRGDKGAIAAVRELVAAGVDLIEQPSEGLARLAAVRRSVDIPVIADESVWQPHDVVDAVREGAVDAISVYVAKAGGLSRAKTVAAVAEVFGLPCDVNGSLESGVGNAANLHFGISTPACTLGCVIPVSGPQDANTATSGRYFEDDVVKEPMSFVDGGLVPSDRPGLGFEIDEDKLREHSL